MATPEISLTLGELEADVGRQVRELRLRANRTQSDLARSANVSVSTLQSLEHGHGSSLATLVAVLRALDRADWLSTLAPPATISPMAMLRESRASGHTRQRASRARSKRPTA